MCVCVFIKLHITAQSGPVILVILCHSFVCVCVCVFTKLRITAQSDTVKRESVKLFVYVCACVCLCACARVRVCVALTFSKMTPNVFWKKNMYRIETFQASTYHSKDERRKL